jgi:hypothetical protein
MKDSKLVLKQVFYIIWKGNVPLKTAATVMGHVDQRMLMRNYAHTDFGDIDVVGKAMSEVFAGL